MKERPILFTPENAQKIFDGSKTQTRRIIKPQPKVVHIWDGEWLISEKIFRDDSLGMRCPYGVVGDRLWVREAFCIVKHSPENNDVLYRGQCEEYKSLKPIWKPSLHMPRWACRTVVELTDVRVERLQDISEEDARAEGCKPHAPSGRDGRVYRRPFECLWESINGRDSWALNPWVWVLEFHKIDYLTKEAR